QSPNVTKLAAQIIRLLMSGDHKSAFEAFQAEGMHVLPVHYYSPVPDTRALDDSLWTQPSEQPGIDWNETGQVALLRDVFPNFRSAFPGLARHITSQVQNIPLAEFQSLAANDILFIDSSHVSKLGSDVNFLFFNVLPSLPPGVIVHIHDIFLPGEFPRQWIQDELRFWNEQYLLRAFLTFNREFEVLLSNAFLAERHPRLARSTFPTAAFLVGGSFWMRRRLV